MTIEEALRGVPYPVCHPPYRGSEPKYVTFRLLGQSSILYAESRESETAVRYMLNLWGAHNAVFDMLREIKPMLESAGYIVAIDAELYDADARLHCIVLDAQCEGAVYA